MFQHITIPTQLQVWEGGGGVYSNGVPTLVHTLVTLRGRPVVGALVLLNVVSTNNTSGNVIDSISMVDDGRADPDLVAGDGIYSAYVFDHVGQIKLEVEVGGGSSTFTSDFTFTFISIFLLIFSTLFDPTSLTSSWRWR